MDKFIRFTSRCWRREKLGVQLHRERNERSRFDRSMISFYFKRTEGIFDVVLK